MICLTHALFAFSIVFLKSYSPWSSHLKKVTLLPYSAFILNTYEMVVLFRVCHGNFQMTNKSILFIWVSRYSEIDTQAFDLNTNEDHICFKVL